VDASAPRVGSRLKQFSRDGMILLLDPDRPAWATVNRLGAEIAGLCDGSRRIHDIAAVLAQKYSKPPEEVQGHVSAFLGVLEKSGLLFYGEEQLPERISVAAFRAPMTGVAMEVTERCNLRCMHCFAEAGGPDCAEPATQELIGWIDKFAGLPNFLYMLTGGEILVRRDWRDILGHLAQNRATYRFITNATLIDDGAAGDIRGLAMSSDMSIQISLDGPNPRINDRIRGKGSFDAALRGIRALLDQGLAERMIISFAPNRLNLGSFDSMIDLLMSLGLPTLHLSVVTRMGRADGSWRRLHPTSAEFAEFFDHVHTRTEELEGRLRISGDLCSSLYDRVKRIPRPVHIGCPLGTIPKITACGDIYPCESLECGEEFRIGNIRDMSADDILASPVLQGLKEHFIPRVEKSPGCRSCEWQYICGAGCMARAQSSYGTIYHGDDLCAVARRIFPKALLDMAERKRSTAGAPKS
jgi:radical SAM protein with 4Fe4S-binding SPASM domain